MKDVLLKFSCIFLLALLTVIVVSCTTRAHEEVVPVETEEPEEVYVDTTVYPDRPVLEVPEIVAPEYDNDVIEALAKMVWGEAGALPPMEQAATVWVVLNRVDHYNSDIITILLAKNQFQGYKVNNPVKPEIYEIVRDVLIRWQIEKECVGSVGRVIPADYLWFYGDGKHNYFRNEYKGGKTWDWSLPNPYAEVD